MTLNTISTMPLSGKFQSNLRTYKNTSSPFPVSYRGPNRERPKVLSNLLRNLANMYGSKVVKQYASTAVKFWM